MQTTISRKVKPMIQDSSQIDKYRQNIFRRPAAQNNFTGNTTDDINRYISNKQKNRNVYSPTKDININAMLKCILCTQEYVFLHLGN